jgi:predicted aspartyl protease
MSRQDIFDVIVTKIIAECAEKGNCDTHYATGTARIPIPGGTGVHSLTVAVNGVAGSFILDTGATFVSVISQFASRAAISTQPEDQVIMKTVGGTAFAEIGYANTIRVGTAEASSVVVAVHRGAANPFGNRVDGLLGMSFPLGSGSMFLKPVLSWLQFRSAEFCAT